MQHRVKFVSQITEHIPLIDIWMGWNVSIKANVLEITFCRLLAGIRVGLFLHWTLPFDIFSQYLKVIYQNILGVWCWIVGLEIFWLLLLCVKIPESIQDEKNNQTYYYSKKEDLHSTLCQMYYSQMAKMGVLLLCIFSAFFHHQIPHKFNQW